MNRRRFRRATILKKRSVEGAGPNLTPMMDMLVIVLVFLLKSFSVSYVGLKPPADLELPLSTSQEPAARFLAVDIKASGIYLEKDLVQPLAQFQLPGKMERDERLVRLYQVVKNKIEGGQIESTTALIRADRETPFDVIWRVMVTVRQLGFEEFQNLVIQDI